MRRRVEVEGLTVNAVAGSHVVFFGLDVTSAARKDLLGFAFRRTDPTAEETTWLRGMKTFESTEPHPAKGETFPTRRHPVQSFQWADYSAKPGQSYTYKVLALYGTADDLVPRATAEIALTTEVESGAVHSAFFNRGSIASQEYARRFENKPPDEAGPGAYEWLSRGLLEALLAFIGSAPPGGQIHGAIYEFQWPAVLQALRDAAKRDVKVRVLFDDIPGKSTPGVKNRAAIRAQKITALCEGRKHGKLMHNKFFVLSGEDGRPTAVWTGSTNLTENGIFGHSNVGHVVRDAAVAQSYRDYWDRLAEDPPVAAEYRDANIRATTIPPVPWTAPTTSVFSPRGTSLDSLDWYADLAGGAQQGLFMTFAFGMQERFREVYGRDDDVLRMALMERVTSNTHDPAADRKAIQKIRSRPNVVIAIGNRIVTNAFDRWLEERSTIGGSVHVYWIHTKYMLVDPLGEEPIVVTGSANFSEASSKTNDENALVIRGDKRIADIYFGEFQRLYTHYAFREAVARHTAERRPAEEWRPQYLIEDDSWSAPYFDEQDRSGRRLRRRYFSGPMKDSG